ncbi:hypothetical protein LG293_16990 (plasmid) [Citricoccus nitrophenolicus]
MPARITTPGNPVTFDYGAVNDSASSPEWVIGGVGRGESPAPACIAADSGQNEA